MRIGIVKADHITDSDLIAVQMIEEGAAIDIGGHSPANGMPDCPRLGFGRIDIPQLFDADSISLRVFAFTQIKLVKKCFGQVATAAFGENGLLAEKFHPRLIAVGLLPIFADAHITCCDPAHTAFIVIKHFSGREAGIDLDTKFFSPLTKPATEIAEADDIVAVIIHLRRCWQAESS